MQWDAVHSGWNTQSHLRPHAVVHLSTCAPGGGDAIMVVPSLLEPDIWREACSTGPPGQRSRQRTGCLSRLRAAKGLARWTQRSFAALRMTSEGSTQMLRCAQHDSAELRQMTHSSHRGTEILRCAQHDSRQDSGQGSPSNVTLSPCAALRGNSATGLARWAQRSFAALRMTGRTRSG
jgi:hypothetical protein